MDIQGAGQGTLAALLRKKGAPNGALTEGKHTRLETLSPSFPDSWQSITFNLAYFPSSDNAVYADSISEIELQIPIGNGAPVYIDHIALEAVYYSIDNFDSERNVATKLVQGTLNQAVSNGAADKTNSSSKCATFKKVITNGNSSIQYLFPAQASANRLKRGIDRFGILLSSPAEPIPVRVSLIDTNVTPHAVHSVYEGRGSMYGTWNFTSLVLSSQPSSSTLDSDVDIISLEIDPGVVSGSLYKFDDFMVYMFVPPAPSTIIGQISPCSGANPYDYSVAPLGNASCEWAILPAGTTTPTSSSFSVQAIFPSSPSSIQCRYTVVDGCYSSWLVKPFTNTNQSVTITASLGNSTACEGGSVNLYGSYTGGNSAQWSSSGTGSIGAGTYKPSLADADLGTVDITYTTLGGNCGAKSSKVSLNVLPKPSFAQVTPDMQVCTTATSVVLQAYSNVGTKVNWFGLRTAGFSLPNPVDNGAKITYTFDPSERVLGNTAQLKVTSDYNYQCGTVSQNINISFVGSGPACMITSASETVLSKAELQLYPSPSTDGNLFIQASEEIKEVQLTNVLGQREIFFSNEIHTSLRGILSVSIRTATQQTVKRVVVE